MMWALFIVPGMIAFLLNVGALACVAMGQAGTDSPETATLLLIRLSPLAGLLGVVPVMAREDLICTCETELCFRNNLMCKLNRTSIFVVMAASFCMLYVYEIERRPLQPQMVDVLSRLLLSAITSLNLINFRSSSASKALILDHTNVLLFFAATVPSMLC